MSARTGAQNDVFFLCDFMLPPLSYSWLSLLFSPSPLHVCLSYFCVLCLCSPLLSSPHGFTYVDISISLLAVVVGFCGLALLVVSLFVFWKLCWPIWRSKALSAHAENGLHVGFPEVPPPANSLPVTECKVAEVEKKKPPEFKVNGRSTVKLQEAAMKISQTSPDIPAEVQTALREKLSQQAKIQRQTTEPTSSSRYPHMNQLQAPPLPICLCMLHITAAYDHSRMKAFLKLMLTQCRNCPDSS